MRALRLDYRGQPNVYRFMRETLPSTVTFQIIPQGAGSFPDMGVMSFENLQFNQLPGNTDFINLFARYKVDKIVTTLTPLFQEVILGSNWPNPPGGISPQLEITKVNSKWMNGDFPIATTAQDQLTELAQIQAKTKTLYAQKKPITLVTTAPGTEGRSVVDSTGNEVDARRTCPWLALSGPHQAVNVPFKHNAVIFAAKVDGSALTTEYKYRVTHKIYFRCSQVG